MITDEPIPYTSTGPAMVNIFAATPKTNPSFLNSMAGDTTALANPVIGTTVPAPAKLAILYLPYLFFLLFDKHTLTQRGSLREKA